MERLRELWTSYRSQILILVALVILVAGWYFKSPRQSQAVETFSSSQQSLASQATSNVSATAGPVCVDVKGAVKHPGVYKLRAGARVDEAIEAAGGVLATADMKQVNRAKQLTDQQVVYIPLPGESIPGTAGSETTATEASGSSDQPIVNLNTATKEQLCQITGIGDKKAELILQYRQEHGQFKSVDDLKQVSGFGDKSVDKIRSQLAV